MKNSEVKVVIKRPKRKNQDVVITQQGEMVEFQEDFLVSSKPTPDHLFKENTLVASLQKPKVNPNYKEAPEDEIRVEFTTPEYSLDSIRKSLPEVKIHAKVGSPSGLSKINQCAGSIAYGKNLPDLPSSDFAEEGNVFHDFMEITTPGYLSNTLKPGELDSILSTIPSKYEDMSEHILSTLDEIKARWEDFKKDHNYCEFYCELKVKLDEDIFGTSDLVFTGMHNKTKKITVVATDYKYGMGVKVKAFENKQGTAYLLGTVETLKIPKKQLGKGIVVIAQVRLDNGWSIYEIPAKDFPVWTADLKRIVQAAKHLYENGTQEEILRNLNSGEHCRFCKCSADCVALRQSSLDAMSLTVQDLETLPDPEAFVEKLTLQEKVQVLSKKSQIEDFLKAVASNLQQLAKDGGEVPGYKLIQTAGRRGWLDDVDKVGKELIALGVKDPYKKSIIGIGAVEKIIGKNTNLLDTLTEKSTGKIELVPASDKRPAIALGVDTIEGAKSLE